MARKRPMLDEIKDEVDRLGDIKSRKRKIASAKDLIEYIQLHFIDCA